MDHLPVNRGFKTHVGFLEGSQSYYWGCSGSDKWTSCNTNPTSHCHDMWHDLLPGRDIVGEIYCSANFYTDTSVSLIDAHAANASSAPLFLHLPYQNVHSPDQSRGRRTSIPRGARAEVRRKTQGSGTSPASSSRTACGAECHH